MATVRFWRSRPLRVVEIRLRGKKRPKYFQNPARVETNDGALTIVYRNSEREKVMTQYAADMIEAFRITNLKSRKSLLIDGAH